MMPSNDVERKWATVLASGLALVGLSIATWLLLNWNTGAWIAVSIASAVWVRFVTYVFYGTTRPWLLIAAPIIFWWVVVGAILLSWTLVVCSCGPPCNF
jgi:hypothetical protein